MIANLRYDVGNLTQVNYADKCRLRSQVVTAVHSSKRGNNITQGEKRALSELKNDDRIVIVPIDKGRTTVILNKVDYHSKIEDHLNNSDVYEPLDNNPIEPSGKKLIND